MKSFAEIVWRLDESCVILYLKIDWRNKESYDKYREENVAADSDLDEIFPE